MIVKLSSIDIPDRFRKEYGNMDDLKGSLEKYGQLQTILLHKKEDERYDLIAGARRFLACMRLGKEDVECIVKENLDELTRRELELEENIQRKDFTWSEKIKAEYELLLLRQARKPASVNALSIEHPLRLAEEVAKELNVSEGTFRQDMELARALEDFPELAKEEKKTAAFKKLKQLEARALRKIMVEQSTKGNPNLKLFHDSAVNVLKTLEDGSIDLVLTDPPYGVSHQDSEALKDTDEKFDDDWKTVLSTLLETVPEIYRVLRPNSHAYFFFGTKWYTEVKALLEEVGFDVEPIPNIWYKKSGQNIFPDSKFTPDYETFFFCKKGKRALNKAARAVFECPAPPDKVHPNQKPLELLSWLISLSSDEYETVLDPFAGSGSTGLSCLRMGRKFVGIEKDEGFFNGMKLSLEGVKK